MMVIDTDSRRHFLLLIAGLFAGVTSVVVSTVGATEELPNRDVPTAQAGDIVFVDDGGIYRDLLIQGKRVAQQNAAMDRDRWLTQLKELPTTVADDIFNMGSITTATQSRVRMMRPSLETPSAITDIGSDRPPRSLWPPTPAGQAMDATLILGSLYDCGKCDLDHLSIGGGVLISSDGLVLTNYHVLEVEDPVTMVARDCHGNTYPVTQFLAGSRADDIALIRIEGASLPFVSLASAAPQPATRILTISHPKNRFFHASWGNVARYSIERDRKARTERRWLEITNPFTRGSSGCGVFDESGGLVGLISRKMHSTDEAESKEKVTDLTFFKCVPWVSIAELLQIKSK